VACYQRDMADPPAYLQDAVIKAAGLGAMAEQIAALKKQLADTCSPDGRGTDAQIEREREIARHAIVGALAAGYAGQAHPGADHWLAAAHDAGATIKSLEAASRATPQPVATDAMLVAGLKECEPLGELIDWREGFGRDEMRAVWAAMHAAMQAKEGT
jgi:hypothetical protein